MPSLTPLPFTFVVPSPVWPQLFRIATRQISTPTSSQKISSTMSVRPVKNTVIAREQSEGVGARVRRSIGRPELRNLDPFLMLDEFHVNKPAGFPE